MSTFKLTPKGEAEFDWMESYFEDCERSGDGISSKETIKHRLLLALTPTRGEHRGFTADTICILANGFTVEGLAPWMDMFVREGLAEELS